MVKKKFIHSLLLTIILDFTTEGQGTFFEGSNCVSEVGDNN